MLKFLRKSGTWALSIITVIFTFVPEAIFEKCKLLPFFSNDINIIFISSKKDLHKRKQL